MDLKIYAQACQLLDLGPLGNQDCGKLCNSRCCKGTSSDGMFLLPGEEKFFQNPDWAKIQLSEEPVTGQSLFFLVCEGHCPRKLRPLACRTFPLLPKLSKEGELELMLDRRGVFICPLVKADNMELFHPAFVRRAKRAWRLLLQDTIVREFIYSFSRQWQKVDEEPWEQLIK